MTRIGAVFNPYHHAPEDFRPAVEAAEEAGLAELWLWEDCFRESAFGPAAAALAWTQNLKIGIGIAPMPLRNVALTAMEIATIDRMFPGRLLPGVGHGVLPWMAQVGARVASPLTLMREYVPALRSLLAGKEMTTSGRYVKLDQVKMDYPPETAPVVYAAGQGPKTLALTGEVADGTVLVEGSTPAQVSEQISVIRQGYAAAGRTDEITIIAYLTAAFGSEGYEQVRAKYSDQEITEQAAWGSVDEVASTVSKFIAAGVDDVVLVPAQAESDLGAYIKSVAKVAQILK